MPTNDPNDTTPGDETAGAREPERTSDVGNSRVEHREALSFRDLEGNLWYAHEVSAESFGSGSSNLLLVSGHELRRISPAPASWWTLSARALLALPHASL